jgi:hypothetical protein
MQAVAADALTYGSKVRFARDSRKEVECSFDFEFDP